LVRACLPSSTFLINCSLPNRAPTRPKNLVAKFLAVCILLSIFLIANVKAACDQSDIKFPKFVHESSGNHVNFRAVAAPSANDDDEEGIFVAGCMQSNYIIPSSFNEDG
jgi:hypothetical protein